MKAVKRGNVITVSTLLWAAEHHGREWYQEFINDSDMFGNTAMHIAARYNNPTMVRILIEEGADVLCWNQRGNSPVHMACAYGTVLCVELLLDSRVPSGQHGATMPASQVLVRDRVGEIPFIDSMNRGGLTALHMAALTGNHLVAEVLVSRGAQLDCGVARGLDRLPYLCGGSTPLHIAASLGDIRTCMVLLEAQWRTRGLELRRMRNIVGLTPLNCALLAGHHSVVRVLIDAPRRNRIASSPSGQDVFVASSLRSHMLHVLHKARLLVVLRDIALHWQDSGVSKDSDTKILNIFGVSNLSLERIDTMRALLENQETSLRDILYGFEQTLQQSTEEVMASIDVERSTEVSSPTTPVKGNATFKSRESEDTQEDCPICMDSCIEVSFESCGHSVCFECASTLCMKPKNDIECPFCRQSVETLSLLNSARTQAWNNHPALQVEGCHSM